MEQEEMEKEEMDEEGEEIEQEEEAGQQEEQTKRPKARDGHRYHCPALVFCNGRCYVSRAAAPEGNERDKVL